MITMYLDSDWGRDTWDLGFGFCARFRVSDDGPTW